MSEMTEALNFMQSIRDAAGYEFVGMVSQNPNSIGKPGVSDVLPEDYSWSKQHRGDGQEKIKSFGGGRSNE